MKFKTDIVIDGSALAKLFKVELTANQSVGPGEIAWNPLEGTFDLGLLNGVKLQSGQEIHFYGKATETISSGDAVMFAGVQGDHILIAKADRSVINGNPNYFIGIATQNFTVNEFGYVTSFGKVRELDTSSYTLGSVLYFDSESSTPGLLTATMPNANQAKIEVAAVVSVHSNQGILMVRTHIMPMLNEIQDVDLTLSKTTPLNADNMLIQDSEDQSIWKKSSWGNIKDTLKTYFDSLYQKGSGTTNYVSKFTGPTTIGSSQIFDNGTNIGIGTATPFYKMHIESSGADVFLSKNTSPNSFNRSYFYNNNNVGIQFLNFGSAYGFGTEFGVGQNGSVIQSNTTSAFAIGTSGAYPILLGTNGTEKMRITSAGNVGIGTTSPSYKLTVRNDVAASTSLDQASIGLYNNSDGGSAIYFSNAVGGRSKLSFGVESTGAGTDDTYLGFSTGANTSLSERMRITSNGDVLIGKTTALYSASGRGLLEINGASGGSSLLALTLNNAISSYLYTRSGDTEFYSTPPLFFSVNGNERMRITSGGNVGIGTSSPVEKLTISGSSASGGIMSIDTSSTTSFVRILGDISSQNLLNWQTGTDLRFATSTQAYGSFTERMRITSGGNVGIGTSSPANKLEVQNGSVLFTNGNAGAYFSSEFSIYANQYGYNAGIFSNLETLNNNYYVSLYASDNSNNMPASLEVQSDGDNSIGTTNRQQLNVVGLIQGETLPTNTTTPYKWIKVFNKDDNTHYFIPVYL